MSESRVQRISPVQKSCGRNTGYKTWLEGHRCEAAFKMESMKAKMAAIALVLVLAGLSACGEKVASDPSSFRCGLDVCIRVSVQEPVVVDQPVLVTIKVTSQRDIPDLTLYLGSNDPLKRVSIEDVSPSGWIKGKYVDWPVNIKAKETLTFTRKILLPAEDGPYGIRADAFLSEGFVVTDYLIIYVTNGSAKVYYEGTRIPITEGPEPASTPGPLPPPMSTTTYP